MAATLDDAVLLQSTDNILYSPSSRPLRTAGLLAAATASTLSVALENQTTSSSVYAYITGLALNNNNALFLLQSDGKTAYYPTSPASNGTALAVNCAVKLGAPGSVTTVTIPQIAGGRIWFCVGTTLTFFLNQGPALVEPSVSNPSDVNYNSQWDFCEFTFNSANLYANISYVDFVAIPIALTLTNTSGVTTHVSGMTNAGLTTVANALTAQSSIDGGDWKSLVISSGGAVVRAVSPNCGIVMNSALFSSYYTTYVNQVWSKYATTNLTIDTQASWGNLTGSTSSGSLVFSGVGSFTKPTALDIFSCDKGPFVAAAVNTAEMGNITARLCGGFNRGTLLINTNQPESEVSSNYYQSSVCNHYSRIVHDANLDKKGYAFPYDDVQPTGAPDVSGEVNDPNPSLFTVTIGGANAHLRKRQVAAPRSMMKRSLQWGEPEVIDEKASLAVYNAEASQDLEMGVERKRSQELAAGESKDGISIPPFFQRALEKYLPKLPALAEDSRLRPAINVLNTLLVSFLSLSLRAFLSRVFLVALVLLMYLLGIMTPSGSVQLSDA